MTPGAKAPGFLLALIWALAIPRLRRRFCAFRDETGLARRQDRRQRGRHLDALTTDHADAPSVRGASAPGRPGSTRDQDLRARQGSNRRGRTGLHGASPGRAPSAGGCLSGMMVLLCQKFVGKCSRSEGRFSDEKFGVGEGRRPARPRRPICCPASTSARAAPAPCKPAGRHHCSTAPGLVGQRG